MMTIYILFTPLLILILNFFFNKNNLLQSLTGDNHQKFVEKKNIPLTGGIVIILSSLFIINFKFQIFYFIFISIFIIGLLSDIKFLKSAKKRFLLQILTIFLFVVYYDLNISNTRVFFIDFFLEYKFFSYIFVSFCLLIVVNGSNFIDGLNGLILGYYTTIITIILYLGLAESFYNLESFLINYLIVLIYLLIFNYMNKLYLGDSGSYFLGLSSGILLIILYNNIERISPFFIVLLLWYPCFENLFSILRKYKFNSSPLKADNKHFHQLLFNYLKKKFNYSNLFINNLSGILINLFNFIIFFIASKDIFNSRLQISLIFLCILIYGYLYFKLFNFRFKK
jgi:UDP-N-acetylmuramyl pentapeptide phosphotransferase/UDP-N-acetylglucosamine-1-phosphate transferase